MSLQLDRIDCHLITNFMSTLTKFSFHVENFTEYITTGEMAVHFTHVHTVKNVDSYLTTYLHYDLRIFFFSL